MKPLSNIATKVQASTTIAIDTMYKKMQADGIDVIGFGAGEPDFDTPDNIKAAAVRAIDNNFTRYTPATGTVELREAICARLKTDCGLDYSPAQIVVSNGAKQSLHYALSAITNPGDEVILPAPYWVSYPELIAMTGGVAVVVDTNEQTGWKMTAEMLEKAITPKTKALIMCSPSNPSGVVYTHDELQALADICVKNDIYVISDEIYYKLIYGGEFFSFASFGDAIKKLTIVVNGVSKSYAMTGWRIGYIAAEPEIAKVIGNFQSHASSAPNSIAQKAATEALKGSQTSIELMRRAFEARLNYFLERAEKIPNIRVIRPMGAFYVMMDVSAYFGKTLGGKIINNADDFAAAFLDKGLVALVPCTGFGAPKHVRWSYATSLDNIKVGLDRLEAFLKN